MLTDQRGRLPIRLVIIVALVVLIGGTSAFVLKSRGGHSKAKEEIKGPVVSMQLGEFLVNLADAGQMRYLKANIVIEVQGEVPSSGGEGESGGTDPKIRDAVIQVLSSKRMGDLAGAEGKEKLKKDIMAAISERMEKAKVVEVYFNEFAMQ
jgi:flagellar protein FliL